MFAIIAIMKLAVILSIIIAQNEEPVLLATAHSTGRLCEAKHIRDNIVACFIVSSIVAISAIGAYIGRKQLVKNTIAALFYGNRFLSCRSDSRADGRGLAILCPLMMERSIRHPTAFCKKTRTGQMARRLHAPDTSLKTTSKITHLAGNIVSRNIRSNPYLRHLSPL